MISSSVESVLAGALERGIGRRIGRVGIRVYARVTLVEGHVVRLAVTIHFDVQSGAQGIDHGGAHAVQATDGVIRRVAELGTGVQFGQYDLHAGQAGFRFLVHRDASAIVRDFHGTVGVQGDHNVVAEAGQGLVHGVVDDLPQAVHQAPASRWCRCTCPDACVPHPSPQEQLGPWHRILLRAYSPIFLFKCLAPLTEGSQMIIDPGSRAGSANGMGGAAWTWSWTRSGGCVHGSRRTHVPMSSSVLGWPSFQAIAHLDDAGLTLGDRVSSTCVELLLQQGEGHRVGRRRWRR